MLIASLLVNASHIYCDQQNITSKKRLIEKLSHYLAEHSQNLSASRIYHALLERERLGSTGLGKGVAIPHTRLPELTENIAIIMVLASPIKYEAADKQPIDIVFCLLIPEGGDDYHLAHLARIAQILRDPNNCETIRQTPDAEELFNKLLAIDDD